MKLNSLVRTIIDDDLHKTILFLNEARGHYHLAVEEMQRAAKEIEIYEIAIAELREILKNDDEIPNP